MTYDEALTFIHSLDKFGSRPGLGRVKKLFDLVPEVLDQKFIHIAGTNGKGSVCMMLESVLRESGLKTGLFISPYITDFRERIQLAGQPVEKETLCDAVAFFQPLLKSLNEKGIIITEFEFLTVLAFWIFKQEQVDVVVCETGMGGLLDSTNLIKHPMCAVLTKIDRDHTAVLGDTIELIAMQKCGIIKNGCPVVSDENEAVRAVIESSAREQHAPLFFSDDVTLSDAVSDCDGIRFRYEGESMRLPLCGDHQLENLKVALKTFETLSLFYGFSFSPSVIRKGLEQVKHPARFEKLKEKPTVILDGAHNRSALLAFRSAVLSLYPDDERILILGILEDKELDAIETLSGLFSHIITTDIQNPRAMSAKMLKALVEEKVTPSTNTRKSGESCMIDSNFVESFSRPTDAYVCAKELCEETAVMGEKMPVIFICGSLYLGGELRPVILADEK